MELSNLPIQALGTLYSRAQDGSKESKKLIDWLKTKGFDFSKCEYTPAATKRANFIRKVIKQVLDKKPNAVILTIGCGFTTYYQELVNPKCYWMDTDLVEITRLKSEYFKNPTAYSNYKCFPLDANKLTFTENGPSYYGVVFSKVPDLLILEGIIMYLDKEKAKKLITGHNIPCVFDVLGGFRDKPLGEFHKWLYKYNEWNLKFTDGKLFDLSDSWIYFCNGD